MTNKGRGRARLRSSRATPTHFLTSHPSRSRDRSFDRPDRFSTAASSSRGQCAKLRYCRQGELARHSVASAPSPWQWRRLADSRLPSGGRLDNPLKEGKSEGWSGSGGGGGGCTACLDKVKKKQKKTDKRGRIPIIQAKKMTMTVKQNGDPVCSTIRSCWITYPQTQQTKEA